MSLENVGNYLESIENTHIVFLYEIRSDGEDFEFNYIKKGLEKAEHCCYTTNEPEEVRRQMSDYGIDVEKYEKRKMLDIISIPESLEGFSKMAEEVITTLTSSSTPCRFVFSNNFEFDTPDRTDIRGKIELIIDDKFSKTTRNTICSYHVARIKQNLADDFMKNLLDSHHFVIIQTKDGKVATFNCP